MQHTSMPGGPLVGAAEAVGLERLAPLAARLANVGFWRVSLPDGRVEWSEGTYAIYGRDPADGALTPEEVMAFMHPDGREKASAELQQAIDKQQDYAFETSIVRADGEIRRLEGRAVYERDAAGRALAVFGVLKDVTDAKRTEQALRESRDALEQDRRMAQLSERLSGHGHWRFDMASGSFTWSDQMFRIYGLEPADGPPTLEQMTLYTHPDDRERLEAHRAANWDTDTEVSVRIVRPDGEIRHVIAKSISEFDDQGTHTGRFGTLTDVTEIKRAEAAAQESEKRYRFLAEFAPDMISRTKVGGEVLYVSPSSERVLGYTPDEVAKLGPIDMVHPEDGERVFGAILGMIEKRLDRLPEPLCYRARHKDGCWIWIEANPILIMDEAGEPVEFIDIVRNVTQTKLFEAELEESRRRAEAAAAAKSTFLANMSHELRTPLTSIIGFSRLLTARSDLPDQAGHCAQRISDASQALLAVINDVLDFSKLEVGQVQLEMQPLSPRRLVEETAGLLTIQAAAKGVEIRTLFDPAIPDLVGGDVARLRQVLLNLIGNAVKFTDEGAVTVSAAYACGDEGGLLTVSVADTGPGIPPEALERLFERFSQAETSINRTHGGTGLGLAICKGIVELMGGRIGVRSEPGSGSTFWFEIPASRAEPAAVDHDEVDLAIDLPQLRVLVVDDTEVNRELVKLMLQPLSLSVEEASGGAAGVEAAMTRPYDLILMDVRMPGIDGLEATRVIRATSPFNAGTPILALTADVQPENAAACRAAGMNALIGKPISPQELLCTVAEWADRAEADAEEARPRVA